MLCVNNIDEADTEGYDSLGGFSVEGSVSCNFFLQHRHLFDVCLFHFARKDELAAGGHMNYRCYSELAWCVCMILIYDLSSSSGSLQ